MFIKVPGRDTLITYEIPEKLLETFFLYFEPNKNFLILSYKYNSETPKKKTRPIPPGCRPFRKADHRLFYWDYTGDISGKRGYIEERFRTTINGEIYATEIRLKCGKIG